MCGQFEWGIGERRCPGTVLDVNCFDAAPSAEAQAEMVAAVDVFGPPPAAVRTPRLSAQQVRELVVGASSAEAQVAAVACCEDPELLAAIIAAASSTTPPLDDPAVDAIWVSNRTDPHRVVAAAFENRCLDPQRRWELFDTLVAAERQELIDVGMPVARAFLAHGPLEQLRERVATRTLPQTFTVELLEAALAHPELLVEVFASSPRSLDRAARLWGPRWLWEHPAMLVELVPALTDETVDNLFGFGPTGALQTPERVPAGVLAALARRPVSTQSKLFTWVLDHVDALLDTDEGAALVAHAYSACAPKGRGWMRTIRGAAADRDLTAVPTERLELFPATPEAVTELLSRHRVGGAAAWRVVAAELAEATTRNAGALAADAVLVDADRTGRRSGAGCRVA